jgi:hypothetical protein
VRVLLELTYTEGPDYGELDCSSHEIARGELEDLEAIKQDMEEVFPDKYFMILDRDESREWLNPLYPPPPDEWDIP